MVLLDCSLPVPRSCPRRLQCTKPGKHCSHPTLLRGWDTARSKTEPAKTTGWGVHTCAHSGDRSGWTGAWFCRAERPRGIGGAGKPGLGRQAPGRAQVPQQLPQAASSAATEHLLGFGSSPFWRMSAVPLIRLSPGASRPLLSPTPPLLFLSLRSVSM